MSAELGKMDKPSVAEFKKGRKLYFIPLIYGSSELTADYLEIFDRYWKQVEGHIVDLELKLGQASRIYHELITLAGEDGIKALRGLNDKSCQITESRIKKGAQLEALEDVNLLTEFMDWSRCLAVGLQNQKVLERVYESYVEASKKRNEFISSHINETLTVDEIGILFMREGHQVTFPSDVEVFYVSPPALDEIKRWLRDREEQSFHKGEDK